MTQVVIIRAVPELRSVLGISAFVLLVCGILGVQLFAGALRYTCYDVETGARAGRGRCGGMAACAGPAADRNSGCLPLGENLGRGVVDFDSFGHAVVSIFVVMTREGFSVSPQP